MFSKARLLAAAATLALAAACTPPSETEPDLDGAKAAEEGQTPGADDGLQIARDAAREVGEDGFFIVSDAELAANPLLQEWDTPYGVPPFSEIREEHYAVAFQQGIKAMRADIEAIATNSEPADFENTVVALDKSGELLTKVALVFFNINNTESTDATRALQRDISPALSREQDAITFNPLIWERVKAVYEQRDDLDLDDQEARLLELTHRDFVRQGADLPADAKVELAAINSRIAELTSLYGQNLLASTNAFEIIVEDESRLAGLSDDFKDAIQQEGGSWRLTVSRSVYETFMAQAEDRDLRRRMFDGYRLRATEGDTDNGPIAIEIAQLRAQRAALMGYETHAHYQLETRMAKTPQEARDFLLRVWRPALEQAKRERDEMAEMMPDGQRFAGHDWWHLSEKVRQERFDLDDNALKPYFDLEAVRGGAFDMAERLFDITIVDEPSVEGWNDVVTSYVLTDNQTGEHLGVFMMDMYARDSKRGGAWMSAYREASDFDGTGGDPFVRPIITNNMNLIRPREGQPTLMRFDEVETLFHEFGHGLHGLLTQIRYPRFSGVSGPRDYTEFPAQILEHWAGQPEMLALYARHNETGEPIPQELVDRLNAARNHNQGFRSAEFIAASLLDLAWHSLTEEEAAQITDARAFEKAVLDEIGLIEEIEPRYRSQYFSHIFAGGYSAGYYAYLWSEILDADGFEAFLEAGDIFDPETTQRLKTWVYEAGGLREADELYREFRGADPSIEPLLRGRGFLEASQEG